MPRTCATPATPSRRSWPGPGSPNQPVPAPATPTPRAAHHRRATTPRGPPAARGPATQPDRPKHGGALGRSRAPRGPRLDRRPPAGVLGLHPPDHRTARAMGTPGRRTRTSHRRPRLPVRVRRRRTRRTAAAGSAAHTRQPHARQHGPHADDAHRTGHLVTEPELALPDGYRELLEDLKCTVAATRWRT